MPEQNLPLNGHMLNIGVTAFTVHGRHCRSQQRRAAPVDGRTAVIVEQTYRNTDQKYSTENSQSARPVPWLPARAGRGIQMGAKALIDPTFQMLAHRRIPRYPKQFAILIDGQASAARFLPKDGPKVLNISPSSSD